MRHHRRLIKRLSLRAGVRLVCRRVRYVSPLTLERSLRWEVRAWASHHVCVAHYSSGATRREAIANAARTLAWYCL